MPEILNPKQTAEYLRIHLVSVYRYIKKGIIPAKRIGGTWRVRLSELEKMFERKRNQPKLLRMA